MKAKPTTFDGPFYTPNKCNCCNKTVSYDEIVVCTICNEKICIDCFDDFYDCLGTIPELINIVKIENRDIFVCLNCIEKVEIDIINKTKKDELPLLINRTFRTDKAIKLYNKLLKGGGTD